MNQVRQRLRSNPNFSRAVSAISIVQDLYAGSKRKCFPGLFDCSASPESKTRSDGRSNHPKSPWRIRILEVHNHILGRRQTSRAPRLGLAVGHSCKSKICACVKFFAVKAVKECGRSVRQSSGRGNTALLGSYLAVGLSGQTVRRTAGTKPYDAVPYKKVRPNAI